MGGGGYVAGPAGLAALSAAPAAGADRGRQPPRPRQPPARPARAARLPRVPDRRPRGRALPGHRAPGAGGGPRRRPRRGARRASDRRRRPLPAGLRRQPGRPLDQPLRPRCLRWATARRPARDYHVIQITGHRDYPVARERLEAAGGAERYTLLEYEPNLADALAACDLVLARAGGSVFELAAAGRPAILVPYPHATAGHQDANAAWMAEAGAAVVVDDAELDAEHPGSDGGGPVRRSRRGWSGWPPPRARSPGRTPPSGSPRRCWTPRGDDDSDERLEPAQAALHRHRRRRDERPGAGLPPARRAGERQDRAEAHTSSACARRGWSRGWATTPTPSRRTPRWSSRPRSARTTPSSRGPASAASR